MKTLLITLLIFTSVKAQTINEVWNYAYHLGIKHHDIFMGQVALESSYLKSNIFKTNNNMLGMKMPKQRRTTAIGEKNGFAYYRNWKDCVLDYLFYQQKYYTDDNEDYYEFLKRMGYCEKDDYVDKLKGVVWGLWSC
jgi:uncharacterized FlgJ-related protein